jgi:hypothetical protein
MKLGGQWMGLGMVAVMTARATNTFYTIEVVGDDPVG